MSSLLQFTGQTGHRGVRLEFTHEKPKSGPNVFRKYEDHYRDGIYLPGGKFLPRIYTAWRRPRGMFGYWVIFRYNGEDHVPDLSYPIGTEKLPRDYKVLSISETIESWMK